MAHGILGFVGRQAELSSLREAIAAARTGNGSTWLLVGEPGIGKSRLVEELAREAVPAGFAPLWGRCWEAGGAPAFWPWIQILREALRVAETAMLSSTRAPHLVQLVPELRERFPDLPEPPPLAGDNAQFMLLDSVTAALCAAARTQPLFIALDDLHAASPSSLLLLDFVSHHVRSAPILIAGTYRQTEGRLGETGRLLQRIAQTARTLALAPLERDEVREFLDQAMAQHPTDELVAAIAERAEGNPLFLVELSRLVIARGATRAPTGDVVPPTLRTALQRRFENVSSATRDVLELASVAGRDFVLPRLAGAFACSPDVLHAAAAEAEEALLVSALGGGAYRFRHILLRDALYQEITPERRQMLHYQLARWLETYGVDQAAMPWPEIAHHYFASGEQGREAAIDALERAGQQAVATFAFAEAIASYRSALQIVDLAHGRDDRRRAELMIGLGHAQLHGGDAQTGRDTCLAAAALARQFSAPELLVRAALELGSVLTFAKVDRVLVALLEEALQALGATNDRLRARVMSRLAAAKQPAEHHRKPIDLARDAVALARTTGDDRTLLAALGCASSTMVDSVGADERILIDREHVTLASSLREPAEELRGQIRLAFAQFELGDLVGARVAVESARALATRLAHPFYAWRAPALAAMLALWEGRFAEAEQLIDNTRRIAAEGGDANADAACAFQAVRLARLTGRRERLRAGIPCVVQIFAGTPISETLARVYAAAHGLQLAPHPALADARDLDLAHRDRASLECVAEMIAVLGDRERALRLSAELATDRSRCVTSGVLSLTWDGPLARVRSLLERAAGRIDAAIDAMTDAVDTCRELGGRPMLAWTAHELAALLVQRDRGGDRARARQLLDEAHALARELGMSSAVERIEALRGDSPSVPAPRSAGPRFTLTRAGDAWTIAHGGTQFQLRDGKGLRYLARLVAEPRREFHALDLADAPDAVDVGDAGELLDARALESYKARVRDLEEQLADAQARHDLGAAERATEELEALQAELARAFGIGGRARRAGGAAERARINVQRRLRSAVAQIAEHDAPLARHLERSVRTGVFCSYEPE